MNEPSTEQMIALREWARVHGRTWKAALRQAWETGDYGDFAASNYLQQVRNEFGPAWLVRLSLKA